MREHRVILHLDLDAFFCAVEELRTPDLKGKPFAVGGRPNQRGVVASCSYAARRFGIRSAMPMARALRLCPELIIIQGNHRLYRQFSQQVMDILRAYSPILEQISIDEAFLDITKIDQNPERTALDVHNKILSEIGLPNSIGIASNKLVAKIATEVAKSSAKTVDEPPNAILYVPAGDEADFLAPLDVNYLWGIGPKSAKKLNEIGIRTIGDLARMPQAALVRMFGITGYELWLRARGIDNRPVIEQHVVKSISRETTFAEDIQERKLLEETLFELTKQVGDRLMQKNLEGTTVKLKLRWKNFTTLSRQETLPYPTDQIEVIFSAALKLFNRTWKSQKAVRLLGVGVSGLKPKQFSLWENQPAESNSISREQLTTAVDTLRKKYGETIVQWGKEKPIKLPKSKSR